MKAKLTSRKCWMMAAAFLGSLGTSIMGLASGNNTLAVVGTVCSVVSAAIYAAAEAAVDVERAANDNQTD